MAAVAAAALLSRPAAAAGKWHMSGTWSDKWGAKEELMAAFNQGFEFKRTTYFGVLLNNTPPQ